jgi:radical SAM superfamily enzyme YgiQ (UPF0313 family)
MAPFGDSPATMASPSRTTGIHTLLVHAPKMHDHFGPVGSSMSINYLAVGLPALAAAIENSGRSVEILHLGVQSLAEPGFDLAAEAQRLQPRLVGLSLHWHAQSWDTIEAARAIKRGCPSAFVVLGGFSASVFPEEILADHPCVDAVIRGDADSPLTALASALDTGTPLSGVPNLVWRKNGEIVTNENRWTATSADLIHLDYERFDLVRHHERYIRDFCGPVFLPHSRSRRTLMALAQTLFGGGDRTMILPIGRGCSVSCGWCGGGRGAHKKYQNRSGWSMLPPGRIAALIARSVDIGFKGVQSCFDPTPKDPAVWVDAFERVRASNVHTSMFFESYAIPHVDLIASIGKSFPRRLISMSPESPNESVRKRFRPMSFSNDELVESVRQCAAHKVDVLLCFGQGLPGESPDSLKDIRSLVKRCKAEAKGIRFRYRSFSIEMEPGSPWANAPKTYGIELHRKTFADYLSAHSPHTSGPGDGLGYTVNSYFNEDGDFANKLHQAACKEMCPLPPSPRLGHLTCKILRSLP